MAEHEPKNQAPEEITIPVNQVIANRLKKLNQLRQKGINPYPHKFVKTHSTAEAIEQYDSLAASETEIKMAGRIMAIRKMGKALFFHFQDEFGRLQGYMKKNVVGDEPWAVFELLDLGDIIGMTGKLFTTKTGEKTIQVTAFELLTKSLHPLPDKWHGLTDKEARYRQRYVDLIVNPEVREVFRLRSKIISAIREFLSDRGFMEMETPILQPLYGGGAALPFDTHHEKLDMKLYLRIADELYLKRLIVGGYEKVWEFCKDFRNEGMDRKHNPEFSMIELYQAYADYNDIMELFEELLRFTVKKVFNDTKVTFEGNVIDFGVPFKRISMMDAIKEKGGPDLSDFDFDRALKLAKEAGMESAPLINHGKVVEAFFEQLVEPNLIQPTFITDFPKDISPLAKVHRDNPRLAERFEIFIGAMECGNAFSELNDPIDQKERFIDQGKVAEAGDAEAHQLDHDFINALSYGMPDQHSIRDVIFFPQMRPEDRMTSIDFDGVTEENEA